MSEEIKNEDVIEDPTVVPAVLEPGEAVIPQELVEKYEAVVEELTNKAEEETPEAEVAEEPATAEEPKNVISSGSARSGEKPEEVAGLTSITGGVIGTGTVKSKKKSDKTASKTAVDNKVAIYSSKNVTWSGVGKVYRGYNIVTKEQADQWLTRSHTRLATPQEVAQEFGK